MSNDMRERNARSMADRILERVHPDRRDAVRPLLLRLIDDVYVAARDGKVAADTKFMPGPDRDEAIAAALKRADDAFAGVRREHDAMLTQLEELRARRDNGLRGDDDATMNAAIVQRVFALPVQDAIMLVRTTNDARIVRALRDFPTELNPISAEFIEQAVTRLGAMANPKLAAQISELETVHSNVGLMIESVRIGLDELKASHGRAVGSFQ